MLINSQRTLYGIDIQLCMLIGKEYIPAPNTTLNEKFNLDVDLDVDEYIYPTLKYYTVGVGGNVGIFNKDVHSYSDHGVMDAALFKHVPFVIRKIDEDLTDSEQFNYRFKIKEIINGIEYYCYYLKLIPNINYRNSYYNVTVTDGLSKLSLLDMNTDKYLNPVERDRLLTEDNYLINEYATKSIKLEFSLLGNELVDLNNAISIKYGDGIKLKEIGVCSGVEIENKATKVQIVYHASVDIDTMFHIATSKDIIRAIEIGGMESIRL